MAMPGFLSAFLFPLPASLFLNAVSLLSLPMAVRGGLSEAAGKPLGYSKFWNACSPVSGGRSARVSSRVGMLLAYTPSLLASAASFKFIPPVDAAAGDTQASGSVVLDSAIPIWIGYFTHTLCLIYAQHLTVGMPEPSVDLKHIGAAVFAIGIVGNFYHHYLLSKLRDKDDNTYKIPKGGLFGLVMCPHYLFEIVTFLGISLIAQTINGFPFTFWTVSYLMGRSHLTKKWYLSKFDSIPRDVKALIPFVF